MKYEGWKIIQTRQSKEILTELLEAKEEKRASMIIANTGEGKSTAIQQFLKVKNKGTYHITLGDSYTLPHLFNEIRTLIGLPARSLSTRDYKFITVRQISQKINELAKDGYNPCIILDEAENARIPVLKAVKEIYDAVIRNCGIVLIGTNQLLGQLNKKALGQSIPQVRRRFKAGTRLITPFSKSKDLQPFFDMYIAKEPALQDLLIQLCDNYGELHDYLDPVLRYCAKKNQPISEEIFRLYHKLPKIKK